MRSNFLEINGEIGKFLLEGFKKRPLDHFNSTYSHELKILRLSVILTIFIVSRICKYFNHKSIYTLIVVVRVNFVLEFIWRYLESTCSSLNKTDRFQSENSEKCLAKNTYNFKRNSLLQRNRGHTKNTLDFI